ASITACITRLRVAVPSLPVSR
ncbi:PTS transporter subunit EIIB, partial [Listeria monocytogenes]|nr:PTS transporter subunit EIIB [Listeria monocytogenes]